MVCNLLDLLKRNVYKRKVFKSEPTTRPDDQAIFTFIYLLMNIQACVHKQNRMHNNEQK